MKILLAALFLMLSPAHGLAGTAEDLEEAISYNDKARVVAILDGGHDVNSKTSQGRVPLLSAILFDPKLEMLKLLLERGAKPTPYVLRNVIDKDEVPALKMLLAQGVDLDAEIEMGVNDDHRGTLLMYAVQRYHQGPVEALLAADAKVDLQDSYGMTALHLAAKANQPAAVKALLVAGADKSLTDKEGHTPLSIAQADGRAELVALLSGGGSQPASVSGGGRDCVVLRKVVDAMYTGPDQLKGEKLDNPSGRPSERWASTLALPDALECRVREFGRSVIWNCTMRRDEEAPVARLAFDSQRNMLRACLDSKMWELRESSDKRGSSTIYHPNSSVKWNLRPRISADLYVSDVPGRSSVGVSVSCRFEKRKQQ